MTQILANPTMTAAERPTLKRNPKKAIIDKPFYTTTTHIKIRFLTEAAAAHPQLSVTFFLFSPNICVRATRSKRVIAETHSTNEVYCNA